jgi:hypothetical protein
MNLEKFDLEKVIHGAKVVTRDGREVLELTKFENLGELPLVGVVDGHLETWSIKGEYSKNTTSKMDLFIEGKLTRGWLNIYCNKYGQLYTSYSIYVSEEIAIKHKEDLNAEHYIKTIEITDEV